MAKREGPPTKREAVNKIAGVPEALDEQVRGEVLNAVWQLYSPRAAAPASTEAPPP